MVSLRRGVLRGWAGKGGTLTLGHSGHGASWSARATVTEVTRLDTGHRRTVWTSTEDPHAASMAGRRVIALVLVAGCTAAPSSSLSVGTSALSTIPVPSPIAAVASSTTIASLTVAPRTAAPLPVGSPREARATASPVSTASPTPAMSPFLTEGPPSGLGFGYREFLGAIDHLLTVATCDAMPFATNDHPPRLVLDCRQGSPVRIELVGLVPKGLANLSSVQLMVERPGDDLVVREDVLFATLAAAAPPAAGKWLRALIDAGPQPTTAYGTDAIVADHQFGKVRVTFGTPMWAPENFKHELLMIRGVAD
jgi:hypothetical protein